MGKTEARTSCRQALTAFHGPNTQSEMPGPFGDKVNGERGTIVCQSICPLYRPLIAEPRFHQSPLLLADQPETEADMQANSHAYLAIEGGRNDPTACHCLSDSFTGPKNKPGDIPLFQENRPKRKESNSLPIAGAPASRLERAVACFRVEVWIIRKSRLMSRGWMNAKLTG